MLILLLALFSPLEAAFAPDVAPNLPTGWCDLQYGSPTRSTGECICAVNCQGAGCRTESGAIWFAYAECPSCQCVSGTVDTKFTRAHAKSSQHLQEQEERQNQQRQHSESLVIEEEPDEVFDLQDWLDENFNIIFGSVVTLGVLFVSVAMLSGALSPGGLGEESGRSTDSLTGKGSENTQTKGAKSDESAKDK